MRSPSSPWRSLTAAGSEDHMKSDELGRKSTQPETLWNNNLAYCLKNANSVFV